jgi:membrane protease YdiL (CAAX protease family)
MWTANVLAALLFGALHLPFTATIVAITPALVARALLLNGLAGVIFGWLYWRRSLEAAMVAHATVHVALTL